MPPPRLRPRPRLRLRSRPQSKLPAQRLATLLSVAIAFVLLLHPCGVWAADTGGAATSPPEGGYPPAYPSAAPEDAAADDAPDDDGYSHSHLHSLFSAGSDQHDGWFTPANVFSGPLELVRNSLGLPSALSARGATTISLVNGEPGNLNVGWGEYGLWTFPASEIFSGASETGSGSSRRQTVRLSFNTCLQPQPNATQGAKQPSHVPPQLQLYVSNTTSNQAPGPNVTDKAQEVVLVDRGFAELTIEATEGVWVGVYAPSLPGEEKGQWQATWNYDLALTTAEEPFYSFEDKQFLYLVDTDDSAALFVTGNLSSTAALSGGVDETLSDAALMQLNATSLPYTLFAVPANTSNPKISGIEKSYCALSKSSTSTLTQQNTQVDMSMTTRGLGNHPKQQFHLRNLKQSTSYYAFLARPTNTTGLNATAKANVQGTLGGKLWNATRFLTKSDGNCGLIYNLPFCSEVAYAVPSNPTVFNTTGLTYFYDGIAESWWGNFSYTLQQVACNASSDSMYSLVRNCDDCAAAYKNWLCAVTIPRCTDFSSDLGYTSPRSSGSLFYNATSGHNQTGAYEPPLTLAESEQFAVRQQAAEKQNGSFAVNSRNPEIDAVVKPGAYKEIKPCVDLCWSLVQSCPSNQFGFGCPSPGSWGESVSYGQRDESGDVTCSYLGAVYFLGAASRAATWWGGGGALLWVLAWAAWWAL